MAQSEKRHYWVGSPNQRPKVLSSLTSRVCSTEAAWGGILSTVLLALFKLLLSMVISHSLLRTPNSSSIVTTSLDSKGAKLHFGEGLEDH